MIGARTVVTREKPRFLAIVGPTTTGKTDLSLAIAEELPIEIVSMDSRQVYRGMDIGTDKVTDERRHSVPHHGLDLVRPDERYSAGQYARAARGWIDEIEARGGLPVLVGGTGFFLRAVTDPIFTEPELPEWRLRALREYLGGRDTEELVRFVGALDPERAELAVQGGPQRMSRTIEVALLSGIRLSDWHRVAEPDGDGVPGLVVVLDLPREELDRRINERVTRMVERGLVDEVKGLVEAGFADTDPGMSGTGYREMAAYLRGERQIEEAIDEIRRNTRRYARRQLTWFRNQLPKATPWIDASRPISERVARVLHELRVAGLAHPEPREVLNTFELEAGADTSRSTT